MYKIINLFAPLPRYMELLNNVPEEMKREWYFQVILEKLLKYGLVGGLNNLVCFSYKGTSPKY